MSDMDPNSPAVTCTGCQRAWNSAAMADGLRRLGACPRCGAKLAFAADQDDASPLAPPAPADAGRVAPHLVLGMPRR